MKLMTHRNRSRLRAWSALLVFGAILCSVPEALLEPRVLAQIDIPLPGEKPEPAEPEKEEPAAVPKIMEQRTPFKDSPLPDLKGKNDRFLVVDLHQEFNQPLLYLFRRAQRQIKRDKSIRAMIISMDTPGGRVDVLQEIIGIINEIDVPVYLYVVGDAISAGALLSFSTQGIYMTANSQIGDAAPIFMGPGGVQKMGAVEREKIQSYLRSMVRTMAQNNGYRQEVGVAMIDAEFELQYGEKLICAGGKQGELLTMTAREAAEIMPDGKPLHAHAVVKDMRELLQIKGLDQAEMLEVKVGIADKIARFLTMLAPLFIVLAIIGIYIELNTPGFGVPGLFGVACLAAAFFGHHIAGLAGWGELILILLGLVLLGLEIFVIPGFGVCGITGIGCILGGLVWMMVPRLPRSVPGLDPLVDRIDFYLQRALLNLVVMIVLAAVAFFLLRKWLPKTVMFRKLVLDHAETREAGYSGSNESKNIGLVGAAGIAATDLRPSGIATIENRRVDVVSLGEYIHQGERIRVKAVKGARVVVVKVKESEPEPQAETDADPQD